MIIPLSKLFALQGKQAQSKIQKNDLTVTDLEEIMDTGTIRLVDLSTRINGSYTTIFSLNSKLSSQLRTLNSVSKIASALDKIVTVITLLPIPTTPFVTVGLITTLAQKLVKINEIIQGIGSIVSQLKPLINSQLNQLLNQKQRLDALSDKLISTLDKAGVAEDYTSELSKQRSIDFSIGFYDEYKFYLKEEKVGSLTRHYAIAVKDAREYYRTEKSFTLNPSILTEQLISIIEQTKTKNESGTI